MRSFLKREKSKKLENQLNTLQKEGPAAWAELPEDELFTPAGFHAEQAEATASSNYSYWGSTFRAFFKNKAAVALLIALVAVVAFAFLQPYLPGQADPNLCAVDPVTGIQYRNIAPGQDGFIWGSNSIGQDLWARIWAGARTSLTIAFFVALIEAVVGITAGVLWGYVRGLDFLFTELYNIFDNIPTAIVLILISYVASPSIWTMILGMSIKGWIEMARFIRNQILIIRDRDYNVASRCIGTPTVRIVLRNLLPYLVSVIMLRMALTIPEAIGNEVFITYIGLGLSVETPSLGNLVNDGRKVMMQAGLRYQLLYPTLILSFVTIAFYPLGAGAGYSVQPARPGAARHPRHRPGPVPGRSAGRRGRVRLRQERVHQEFHGPVGHQWLHHRRHHRLLPYPQRRADAPVRPENREGLAAHPGPRNCHDHAGPHDQPEPAENHRRPDFGGRDPASGPEGHRGQGQNTGIPAGRGHL